MVDQIQQWLFDLDLIVTYRFVSHELTVPSDVAKQLLYQFYSNPSNANKLKALYFVSGEKTKKGNTTIVCRVVPEDKLARFKSRLSSVTSTHLYSLQKSVPSDSAILFDVDWEEIRELETKNPIDNPFSTNSLSSIECTRISSEVDNLAQAKRLAVENRQQKKSRAIKARASSVKATNQSRADRLEKEKSGSIGKAFGSSKKKAPASSATKSTKSNSASNSTTATATTATATATKKKKQSIGSFFTKRDPNAPKETVPVKIKTDTSQATNAKATSTKKKKLVVKKEKEEKGEKEEKEEDEEEEDSFGDFDMADALKKAAPKKELKRGDSDRMDIDEKEDEVNMEEDEDDSSIEEVRSEEELSSFDEGDILLNKEAAEVEEEVDEYEFEFYLKRVKKRKSKYKRLKTKLRMDSVRLQKEIAAAYDSDDDDSKLKKEDLKKIKERMRQIEESAKILQEERFHQKALQREQQSFKKEQARAAAKKKREEERKEKAAALAKLAPADRPRKKKATKKKVFEIESESDSDDSDEDTKKKKAIRKRQFGAFFSQKSSSTQSAGDGTTGALDQFGVAPVYKTITETIETTNAKGYSVFEDVIKRVIDEEATEKKKLKFLEQKAEEENKKEAKTAVTKRKVSERGEGEGEGDAKEEEAEGPPSKKAKIVPPKKQRTLADFFTVQKK
eukprot:TRINITY_DN503_c0_g1_i1.p1 TRINITY_DN503_c0_g1~~TRINITY_DN503_c0_g1_i1.p1  ORF type:complete len:677 (+),score=276.66 TRINITY_DN503_c0_g1_i1:141-2171(+)